MTPGDTVSHYRILSFLGAGGMGEVYKAEDTRLKRAVALKFLPLALLQDEHAKQRLLVEARAISALDHQNICTIHEIDESADGRVFLAMAYYEGETLKQRIARGPAPIDEALDIVIQVTRGVAAAHEAGIIHRDIKPANIFLCARQATRSNADQAVTGAALVPMTDEAARVKLLDFGIAKMSGETALTRTGTTVGTLAYMAPEHFAGGPVDARADVWSLGVVLYELLVGPQPFEGTHELALMKAIGDQVPRPLREIRPEVPPAPGGRRRDRPSEGAGEALSHGARSDARTRGRSGRHGRCDAARRVAVARRKARGVQHSCAGHRRRRRGHRPRRDGVAGRAARSVRATVSSRHRRDSPTGGDGTVRGARIRHLHTASATTAAHPDFVEAAQRVVPARARAHRTFWRRGLRQGVWRADWPTGCHWAGRPSRRAGRLARFAGG